MVSTQDETPQNKLELSEVGVVNLKTLIRISRNDQLFTFVPEVKVTINLPPERKGAHLSRFVESTTEILSTIDKQSSVEEMTIHVLKELNARHPFVQGQITLTFDFVIRRETPITKRRSLEVYKIEVLTVGKKDYFVHRITVQSLGNTVCPHAYTETGNRFTHIQRAIGKLTLEGELKNIPSFEDMIEILEQSFSAPTYTVLKSADEAYIVEQMFNNKLFAEDVARNILAKAAEKFTNDVNLFSEVISEESIHKHDVLCKGNIIRNTEINMLFKGL